MIFINCHQLSSHYLSIVYQSWKIFINDPLFSNEISSKKLLFQAFLPPRIFILVTLRSLGQVRGLQRVALNQTLQYRVIIGT